MRPLLSIFCAAALTVGFSFTASADSSAPDPGKKPPEAAKVKGKTGDACKTSADCDQSSNRQSCRDSKCQVEHVVHPTT